MVPAVLAVLLIAAFGARGHSRAPSGGAHRGVDGVVHGDEAHRDAGVDDLRDRARDRGGHVVELGVDEEGGAVGEAAGELHAAAHEELEADLEGSDGGAEGGGEGAGAPGVGEGRAATTGAAERERDQGQRARASSSTSRAKMSRSRASSREVIAGATGYNPRR